ncbi:MAG: hypothetical protein WBJ10_08930 [Daejeonella sp.]|uniref:hypothetical protein n=1 Tax=Daejeonella sp. TaxID=2805397 RepID=UPI003C721846
MRKQFAKKLFSYVFLFIFFAKMAISVAPMVAIHMDSEVVNAVIMQLEIENHSTKGADQAKDSLNKGEWLNGPSKFKFFNPQVDILSNRYILLRDNPIRAFFPSVPTPPPNC